MYGAATSKQQVKGVILDKQGTCRHNDQRGAPNEAHAQKAAPLHPCEVKQGEGGGRS